MDVLNVAFENCKFIRATTLSKNMGEFRAIQECDSSATIGYINWNKNWITFMDNMLQMKILQSDTRLLYVPTYIAKLTINSQKHLEWIHNKYTNEGKSTDLPVFNDQSTGIISCGGINIWGLTASSIARRKYLGSPVLESYKFVPNITSLTTEQSIRVTMQVILENTLAYKIKVVELVDDYSAKGGKYLTPVILSVLEDQPLIQPCVKILSKTPLDVTIEVEDKELSSESDCSLVIGTSILGRSEVKKGFILSRESLNFDMSTTNHLPIEVITVHKTETDYLILFQNCPSLKKCIRFPISSSNNFSWVPALKDIIEKKVNDDIVIYSENEPNSGILGLINCLRREPNGQNIRCVFVMDKDTKVQPDNSNYTAQLKKCMAINVFKNGQWGTYRHLLLHECDDVESEHCFANVTVRGDLSSLRWVQGPLRHDQVITPENKLTYIYYAALNFRDIMTALGKIDVDIISQDRKEQECVQGLEFSGRDERGNRLMGIVNTGALSTLVLVDSTLTFKVPDAWSFQEAATVPVVYLTVLYALHTRGNLKHGETILIHSGTGGIGLAAIQLALHHGCTVFTTEMIFKGTKGRGVDMVLNSLAEDKLLASVRCLARGGRFIEIGKFDLANNNQLNLLLFKKNVSFQGVMLDMLFKESPRNKLILSQLMAEGIRSGAIKPLKRTIFKFNEVEQAFRFMASGKHMGKVLIQIRESENQLDSLPSIQKFHCIPRYLCDPDMVYMIIGGLGGFGLELADWLVLRGAKKLVLTSRSGISTGYQNYRIRLWQSYGTIVKISKSDITSRSGCQELIEESQELGPIDAVFNLAVVLNDSIFENQTPDSFNTAFAPKALATQYLDELTRKLCPSLRHFVIFSSVSCGRGNPGQTNYGMANSVMERICENRKRNGFPALTVQWGAVGEVGLVAEMKEESTELAIGGTLQQPISSCLRVLDGFLTQNDEVIVSSMVVAEKQGLGVADNIVDAVINVLGVTNIKTISIHSTMAELGMDSMTAVEIKQILERDFEVILNATEMRTMTLARLKEIQTEKIVNVQGTESNNLNAFGLETILRLIGNESESRLLHKRLDSKVDAKAVAPKLLLFPGIEGFFKVFEPLAVHLNAYTISVQYSYYNLNATVEYTAKSLLPIVVEYITKNQPFTILAYSYGVLIALEVVNLLESKDRLDLFVKITKDVSNITESYKRTLASGLYQRIKALKDYNPSYHKLKSKAKLYKARYESIQGLPEDYGLSQLIENPVEVKTFEGNHASVLTNELLVETINAFISEEH
ncbi:hypothetical protein NQ314_005276 [Rhamnusium bicolor]|uniref:Uncharacterized protein n=1 Tax=Rhamnusium bicolor TaxID=1586634 RepID=A0AAV8ZJ67_9CUCU|nr:hypothetical protein NQ314_005276 [Rhamnusium bicolor]